MNHSYQASVQVMLQSAMQDVIDSRSEPPEWAERWRGQERPLGGWQREETEFVLQVHPDGRRFAIYSDKLPLEELGHITTKRASNVEHNDKTQEWEVTLIGEETPRFANKSRQECIKWEVAHIEGRMTEIMLQHFPMEEPRREMVKFRASLTFLKDRKAPIKPTVLDGWVRSRHDNKLFVTGEFNGNEFGCWIVDTQLEPMN